MQKKIYDLIIIGGGPAGSSAAYKAAVSGLKTLLIEKENFPRYKPCGGAVSKLAMDYLDFSLPEQLLEKEVYGARIHYGSSCIEKHKKELLAVLVKRSEFDNFLLSKAKQAGSSINLKEKVLNFHETQNQIKVITNKGKYTTKFLIISEGCHGKLKNKIRKPDNKNEYGICMVTEVPEKSNQIDKFIKNAIDIHFGVAQLGYGWIFPLKNHYSIGIGGLASNLKSPKDVMNNFIKQNGFENSVNKNKIKYKAHKIPAGGIKRKTISHRAILVGDSAGFVDSFSGEGIAYAIKSGQIASELIFEIIKKRKPVKHIKSYEKITMNEFGYDLKYSFIVSKIMHCMPSLFFRIFTSSDTLIDKYLDVAAQKLTYKEFLLWLLPRVPFYLLKSFIFK